jgi:hypothetical protein
MDANKKKIIFLLGSIFVAIIFLSSYAAFSNNGSGSSSSSTIKTQASYFSTGTSNAIISNYSSIAYVTVSNGSNSSNENITRILSQLEANGSVQNYIYDNNSYQVVLVSISAYELQQLLNRNASSNSIINVGATTYVMLPSTVIMYYTNQPITVHLKSRNYSVYLTNVKPIGSVLNVSVSGLLARNGSIYNGQFRVNVIKTPVTYASTGNSNAIISNYSNTAYVTLLNNSNYSKSNFTRIISLLSSNGFVLNYTNTNNSYMVVLHKISPYGLLQMLYASTALNNSVDLGSTTYVTLPNSIILYIGIQPIMVNLTKRNYSIYMNNVGAIGNTVNVSISALVEKNGSIYNNQFKVNYKQ